jgi:hypothetical protein
LGVMSTKHADRQDGPRPSIQWGTSGFEWDGEDLTLTVEHFLHPGPSAWLNLNLGNRIEDELDGDFIARVTGAVWYGDADPASGVEAEGTLRISAPAEAWSDPKALRDAVERAADEAYAASRKAHQTADTILRRLL